MPEKIIKGTASSSTANPASDQLKAADRKAWFYVDRAARNTTCNQLANYIKTKFPRVVMEVEELKQTNSNSTTKSFKLGVDFSLLEELSCPDFWPENIIVRRFKFLRPRNFQAAKSRQHSS